ncbi:MAG: glycosyltransferase family 4 protein [Prosthecobacter sp.]
MKNLIASREPFALERYRSEAFTRRVKELTTQGDFDLVVCDGLAAATAFEGWTEERRIPAVLFQHNVEALIWERLAAVQRHLSMKLFFRVLARRMQRREQELCRLFDGVITISEEDATYHRDCYGLTNVLGCVPAGATIDTRGAPLPVIEASDSPCLAFLGSMDWLPNQDAVRWFVTDILPKLRRKVPRLRLSIIGRNPPDSLLRMAGEDRGITFTGTVDSVLAPLRECALMVVPLRAGSGTRIKILEAMAAGVPVVSTTVGVEGLPLRSNEELLIADDVPGITNAILRLLHDDELRRSLAENGMQRVMRDFSWQQSAECFFRLTGSLSR